VQPNFVNRNFKKIDLSVPPLSEQLPINKVVNLGLLTRNGGFKISWLKVILNRVKYKKCH
jgi:hypothetical protein